MGAGLPLPPIRSPQNTGTTSPIFYSKFLENHYSLFVTYILYTRARCKGDTRIRHLSWRGRTNQHKSIVAYSEGNPTPINFSHPPSSLLSTKTIASPPHLANVLPHPLLGSPLFITSPVQRHFVYLKKKRKTHRSY